MRFSGFLNVNKLDSGEWEYRLGDKVHHDYSLKNLEFVVRMHGLKWCVLDEKLASKSLMEDELSQTGFLNVYIENDYGGGKWCYRDSELKSKDLFILKKNVLADGLEWKIIDNELAEKSILRNSKNYNEGKVKIRDSQFKTYLKNKKQEKLNLRKELKKERKTNISGFFRVKQIDDDYKWEYRSSKIILRANTLDELEKMVLNRKLEWKVMDSRLALISRRND